MPTRTLRNKKQKGDNNYGIVTFIIDKKRNFFLQFFSRDSLVSSKTVICGTPVVDHNTNRQRFIFFLSRTVYDMQRQLGSARLGVTSAIVRFYTSRSLKNLRFLIVFRLLEYSKGV